MPLPDVLAATRSYEEWALACTPMTSAVRKERHRLMAKDPFAFLRGSYYRWVQCWARDAGPLADTVPVLAVGDAHVENFGTWRDAEGRLAWGVDDLDEADTLPWPADLVRLLGGALLPKARKERRLLEAVGREIGNVHLGSAGGSALLADLDRRPDGWLLVAARGMVHAVRADFATFAAGQQR